MGESKKPSGVAADARDRCGTETSLQGKQDFESVINRQREKMEEALTFESKPQVTRADVVGDASPTAPSMGTPCEASQAPAAVVEPPASAAPPAPGEIEVAAANAACAQEAAVEPDAPVVADAEPETAAALKAGGDEASATEAEEAEVATKLIDELLAGISREPECQREGADSESSTDEDMPLTARGKGEAKQNRSEKKSRKAVSKLGMKPVLDVTRVTMRKAPNVLFVIEKPDVFKAPASDTYVVFGEARIEDLSAQAQASAAQQLTAAPAQDSARKTPRSQARAEAECEGEDVDEGGLEPKDIELVMAQADVSRARAVKALKANNSDIVEAIMELSNS